ncbi:hypothetical protein IDJ77_18545 [Mucilaginibacter sp. ZT4R22]|uniref:GLPGLI family protein n=1 Tax=Mucilaginibacter pankratovii TaxID=2772110 RepID=A0ABR7WX33_9SPHI|nr:hypothetical protein [Mucilaginibacter pankratovii]MBD1365822.1 hypothetical protein [Mucilaginibacter pankratovii]
MKRYLALTLLTLMTVAAQAQVRKLFINKNGDVTKDSLKATSYKLYQKLPDSSWLAAQ